MKRALYVLFGVFFAFYRIFVSAFIIYWLRKKIIVRQAAIFLSIILIMLQLMFITSDIMDVFIIIAILFILLLKLYPNNKTMIQTLVGAGFLFSLMFIIIKISGGGLKSAFLQAYFPGVCNMAGIFNMQNESKLSTLFFDFFTIIPFRNTLFGLEGDTSLTVYRISNLAGGQIIPCVGQAFHYIGVFAPIVPAFLVTVAMKYERKRNGEKNIWKYVTYTYIVIYAAITPVLYYLSRFGQVFIITILPMLILAHFSGNAFKFEELQKYE